MKKFKTNFDVIGEKPGFVHSLPSRVKPEFKEVSDLNNIMNKYAAGLMELPEPPVYDDLMQDVSNVPDFLDTQVKLAEATARFEALPSKIRKYFDNSPAQMLQFLQDPNNVEEGVRIGLYRRTVPADGIGDNNPSGEIILNEKPKFE